MELEVYARFCHQLYPNARDNKLETNYSLLLSGSFKVIKHKMKLEGIVFCIQ